MALAATTVWEVRTDGADTNGGGYVTGGTDWSMQAAAQYAVTDAVTNGTTTITSATANFGTDVVGNILYIAGGTGSITAGWYQIISRTNSTTIVVDRSTGLTTGTGATLNIGGALATIQRAASNMTVSGMTTYIKATGVYSIGTGITFPAGPSFTAKTRVIGYTTTRGDAIKPIVRATAGITIFTLGQNGMLLQDLDIDGNDVASSAGVNFSAVYNGIFRCRIRNMKSFGIAMGSQTWVSKCEVTNCDTRVGGAGIFMDGASNTSVIDCYIHDNPRKGMSLGSSNLTSGNVIGNIISFNGVANTEDGVTDSGFGVTYRDNVFHGNGRDGLRIVNAYIGILPSVQGNIFTGNAAYGFNMNTAPVNSLAPEIDYNAYYNNTSGARNNITAGSNDVTLTADPFTDAVNDDFTLNATAGGGAALRAEGFPGVHPSALTGYRDIGPLQHQDAGGGGGASAYTFAT